jgi:hypothetical protein
VVVRVVGDSVVNNSKSVDFSGKNEVVMTLRMIQVKHSAGSWCSVGVVTSSRYQCIYRYVYYVCITCISVIHMCICENSRNFCNFYTYNSISPCDILGIW